MERILIIVMGFWVFGGGLFIAGLGISLMYQGYKGLLT